MKKIVLIFAVLITLSACGKSNDEVVDENIEVTTKTSEKIEENQKLNTELEEIDGELDSLLTKTE